MKKPTLIDNLMAELINYGGFALPRSAVYEDALAACFSRLPEDMPDRERKARQGADLFAFGPRAVALTPEQAAKLIPASEFDRLTR